MTQPFFSIIIPTLNEEENIENLLADIKRQTYNEYEIIVSDGNSNDNTVKIVKKFDVNLLINNNRGVANQRNSGVKEATGEYLLFLDADNNLESSFLDKLKKQIEVNNPDVFTCYVNNNLSLLKERIVVNFLNFYIHLSYIFSSPGAIGACIGCKKDIFSKKTEFVQSMVPFEDGAFVRNLHRRGFNCQIFQEPRFGYSLRRFEENGFINTFLKYIKLSFKRKIFMRTLNLNKDYRMGG